MARTKQTAREQVGGKVKAPTKNGLKKVVKTVTENGDKIDEEKTETMSEETVKELTEKSAKAENRKVVEEKPVTKPVLKQKTEVVRDDIKYTGKLGMGLIQFGTLSDKMDGSTITWEGRYPIKVHVIPDGQLYSLKNDDGIDLTISHIGSGIYKISGTQIGRRVRFFKPVGRSEAVPDVFDGISPKGILRNPENKEEKSKKNATFAAKKEEKRESASDSLMITQILIRFAEKIDKDFNLMSVCDVNARKYAQDYVRKELLDSHFDLDECCEEFDSFLKKEVEGNLAEKKEEKSSIPKKEQKEKATPKKEEKKEKVAIKPDTLKKAMDTIVKDKRVVKTITKNAEAKALEKPVDENKKKDEVKKAKSSKTIVISLKGRKNEYGPELQNAPDDVVYIGRKSTMGGWNLKASEFCNPFKMDDNDSTARNEAIKSYEEHISKLLHDKPELQAKLLSYKGKKLACWCHPNKCHGDILCGIIDQLDKGTWKYEKETTAENTKKHAEKDTKNATGKKGEGRVNKKDSKNSKDDKKKGKSITITKSEFKQWFESGNKSYNVADLREILQNLGIEGVTPKTTKKAMKEMAEKYVV